MDDWEDDALNIFPEPDLEEDLARVPIATKVFGAKTVVNARYKEKAYWEERFAYENSYEWLLNYSDIRSIIHAELKPEDEILVVGCGNSSFSVELYLDGFTHITNIDFSENVIKNMEEKYSALDYPGMKWLVMDMTAMSQFSSQQFDAVLDKGAMDALVVDEGDVWNPNDTTITSIDAMCLEVSRILKYSTQQMIVENQFTIISHDTSSGLKKSSNQFSSKFFQISFSQPHFRSKYLMGYRAEHRVCNEYETYLGYSDRYQWELNYEICTQEAGGLDIFLYKMYK
jgi:hypothetical protein